MTFVFGFPSGLFVPGLFDGIEAAGILCVVLLMSFGIVLSFANLARYQLWGALLVGFAIGTLSSALLIMWILKRLPSC